jgi:hypothetical protein
VFERYRRLLSITIAVADVVLINLAVALAYWLRYGLQWFATVDVAYMVSYRAFIPISIGLTVLFLIIYKLNGVYDQPRGASWFSEVYRIVAGTAIGIILAVFVIVIFFRPFLYSRLVFFYAGVLISVLLVMSRLVQRMVRDRLRRKGLGVDRVLVIGGGEVGRAVMRNTVAEETLGYHVVGFVDDDPEKGATDIGRFKALGETANLPRLVKELAVDDVIITLPWMYHRKIVSIIAQCEREKVRVRIVPDIFQMTLSRLHIEDLAGIPMIGIQERSIKGGHLVLKRATDIVLSSLLLLLLCPIFLLIAVAIKLDSPGPVILRQIRVGKGEQAAVVGSQRGKWCVVQDAERSARHEGGPHSATHQHGRIASIRQCVDGTYEHCGTSAGDPYGGAALSALAQETVGGGAGPHRFVAGVGTQQSDL